MGAGRQSPPRPEVAAHDAILDAAVEPLVLLDDAGTIVGWNRAATATLGHERFDVVGRDAVELLAPPRLRGAWASLVEQARREADPRVAADAPPTSIPVRMRALSSDGVEIPVEVVSTPLPVHPAWRARVGLALRDVSERERLAEAHSRFAGAFASAGIGMALISPERDLLEVNRALADLLDRDPDDLAHTPLTHLVHPDDHATGRAEMRRVLAGEVDGASFSVRLLLADGGIRWTRAIMTLVRDAEGKPLHLVGQVQDITDRKTAESELARYATQLSTLYDRDPLTGLRTRRALEAALAEELETAGERPTSVLLVDVDGEEAIVSVAERLVALAPPEGVVAHLGGGRLAMLLARHDAPRTAAVAAGATANLDPVAPISVSYATARADEGALALLERAGAESGPEDVVGGLRAPARVRRLLELARRQLGMPVSFLTRVHEGDYVLARLSGDYERLGVHENLAMPLEGSHCQRMLDGRIGNVVPDLGADPETADLDVTKGLGLRAYAGVPVHLPSGELYGTLCAVDTKPRPDLSEREEELLRFVSTLAGELIDDEAEQRAARRAEAGATGVRALLGALEARDRYTGEHSKEVVALASAVAHRLGLDPQQTRDVEQVALLHDIGKLGIPDAILQKQGPLDPQEWELMRQHPVVGERIIAGTVGLAHLAPAMRAEHERWDGGGYPDGLAGERIPLASRVTLACDAVHAMTSDRPYRPALSLEVARRELRAGAGSQFDAVVVEALLAELDERGALERVTTASTPQSDR